MHYRVLIVNNRGKTITQFYCKLVPFRILLLVNQLVIYGFRIRILHRCRMHRRLPNNCREQWLRGRREIIKNYSLDS
jgi:hypothetical protein